MKRHEALAPLSREHHLSLILARLLQKDAPLYKDLPQRPAGKIIYAKAEYRLHIQPHFSKEEKVFAFLKGVNEKVDTLAGELIQEHHRLMTCFDKMNAARADTELMEETGKLLEAHIRKEERVLFPLIQVSFPENILERISALL